MRTPVVEDTVSTLVAPAGHPPLRSAARERGRNQFLWFYAAIAGSLLLRFSLFGFESGDYRAFIGPWYDFLVEHGRWHGLGQLKEDFCSYPPLYMYLVSLSTLLPLPKLFALKLIPLASDYVAAWFVWRLARKHISSARKRWAAVTLFLFLPTVVMNSALWGQCDVMYAGAFLASLYYLLERRWIAAMVAFGVAISLKPQAIFWCPLLAGLLLSRRLPWRILWIAPAVYAASDIPAMLAGRPVLDVLLHWGRVHNIQGKMTFGATNWYQWVFENHPGVFEPAGIILALIATVFLALWMMDGPRPGQDERRWVVSMALLSVTMVPFVLPGMHERYFFAADVLSVVYAFYVPGGWIIAVMVQFCSAFSYLPYLFNEEPVPRWALALVMLLAIGGIVKNQVEAGDRVCAERSNL
ncbi:MAG: glycosyltransferase 87 family protein [Candidatus Omnitrophica bacterium]|nr:glycosyltransferase 87 family protein [Candidatus Omnitrophota bacterium]